MGKKSRDKGVRGELEVVKLFQRWFPDTHRNGEKQRNKDVYAPDIGGEVEKHFYIEVKRYKKITEGMLRKFREKLIHDCHEYNGWNTTMVLVAREDKEKWFVEYGPDEDSWQRLYWQDFQDELDKQFNVVDKDK